MKVLHQRWRHLQVLNKSTRWHHPWVTVLEHQWGLSHHRDRLRDRYSRIAIIHQHFIVCHTCSTNTATESKSSHQQLHYGKTRNPRKILHLLCQVTLAHQYHHRCLQEVLVRHRGVPPLSCCHWEQGINQQRELLVLDILFLTIITNRCHLRIKVCIVWTLVVLEVLVIFLNKFWRCQNQ